MWNIMQKMHKLCLSRPWIIVANLGQEVRHPKSGIKKKKKKKSAPELHREYLYTHFLLSLCDHGKPRGRWCEQRASLSSLWQWVILLPNITLWRSPPIFCFWVEAEREMFWRVSMRKIQLFVFNFASSFSKCYLGTVVVKTIMCRV